MENTELAIRELRPLILMPINLDPQYFNKDMVMAKLRAIDIQLGTQVKVDQNAMKKQELDEITPIINKLNAEWEEEKKIALMKDITPPKD